ncbi:MAG: glycerol kinase GlpK [Candidatus Cloacimonadota bacterium]|nr:glycerol kinase GlpK [Candidatus Cloacimonadota bacterium]
MQYIGAIDQGTTSTRFLLFDKQSNVIASHQVEHKQIFPQAGFVEHDPIEIWENTKLVIRKTLEKSDLTSKNIISIGITNQRETTIVWNKKTGIPYHNAIVWQDTRTNKICKSYENKKEIFQQKTGLPIATYFSGPKIKWLLDNITSLRNDTRNGDAIFGNIDSWLIWNLTGGISGGMHITDVTNASRTMLMNLKTLEWDDELLQLMNIPKEMLPEIKSSSEVYGKTNSDVLQNVNISGILGDQQAALFGQNCFNKGDAKNTYGTGCFMLLNTGNEIVNSKYGLLSTVGYKIGNNEAVYALEGSVAIAGSLVQWMRDNFGLIENSAEITKLAKSVKDNGGVYFVPAFSGLFAPHWDSSARGIIAGLTNFSNKGHLARAVLESTAFQSYEVFEAMQKDANIDITKIKVDGGMVVNRLLMQFQSDILKAQIVKPKIVETTALGAAYIAGLSVGYWKDLSELKNNWKKDEIYNPKLDSVKRDRLISQWQKAVSKSINWEE